MSVVSAAENTMSNATESTTIVAAQSWEYYTTVTIYKQNGRIRNANHRVEYNSDSGRYRIQYGGEWHSVSNAPRGCGYTHMFSSGSSTWYFNL